MRRAWTLFSLGLLSQDASARGSIATVQNANHIFNAIHSSMRQWGSSLNHNGMSAFVATVPKGTELYHGTSKQFRVNGTEWLAFEPEHALVFARARGPPPGKGGPPGPDYPPHDDDGEENWHPPERLNRDKFMPWHRSPASDEFEPRHPPHKEGSPAAGQRERTRLPAQQRPLFVEEESPEEESYGYLHTYAPKKDLRLIYLDGQSAAKSNKGTLDLQDIVLLHNNPPPKDHDGPPRSRDAPPKDKRPHPGGPMGESYRADKLCELANTEWEGQVDGILRMELGFEIILCSFERDLVVKRITRTKSFGMGGGPPGGPPGHGNDGDGLAYYQAVASRFDGIGGNRVTLDYTNFVSLFDFKDVIYFDDKGLPRARNDSSALRPVNKAIKEMILQESTADHIDWQAVVDMVVSRYSDRIEYMTSGDIEDLHSLKAEAERLLRPYIDYGNRNKTMEIQRCATQYIPESFRPESLAERSMLNVTTTICSSLSDVSEASTYKQAFELVQDLKSWLAWTTWKRCRGCDAHEVCFVPIWPMGGKKEHEHPTCVSNMSDISRGYWDDGRKWTAHHEQNKNELR